MSEFQDLRDEAKALGLSAAGSSEELAARIAAFHADLDETAATADTSPLRPEATISALIEGMADGTVWLRDGDRTWHVAIDCPAYRLLIDRGATVVDPPEGA